MLYCPGPLGRDERYIVSQLYYKKYNTDIFLQANARPFIVDAAREQPKGDL